MLHARRVQNGKAPPPAPVPTDAPGVAYFSEAGAGVLKFFRCEWLKCSMSQEGCGRRFLQAAAAKGQAAERFESCRACPIGAAHAGSDHVHLSPLYGAAICPRCREGTTRMIGNPLCVGCYNRERELLSGKNARGNAPVELARTRALRTLEFSFTFNGRLRRGACGSRDVSVCGHQQPVLLPGNQTVQTSSRLGVQEASVYVGLSVSTLNKKRLSGDGPPFLKLERRVVYDSSDLDSWLSSQRRCSTSEL